MRQFLYSEVANFHGLSNIPSDPDLAVETGKALCETLLEPLVDTFGPMQIRSAYRSVEVNRFCNARQRDLKAGYTCASNERNYARHIWDVRDKHGCAGATACIVLPWFTARAKEFGGWQALAWWIHDHLPYSHLTFFPRDCAFNIGWREVPLRRIDSYASPKGILTAPGRPNAEGNQSGHYARLAAALDKR
jgi:hypothetical protein